METSAPGGSRNRERAEGSCRKNGAALAGLRLHEERWSSLFYLCSLPSAVTRARAAAPPAEPPGLGDGVVSALRRAGTAHLHVALKLHRCQACLSSGERNLPSSRPQTAHPIKALRSPSNLLCLDFPPTFAKVEFN